MNKNSSHKDRLPEKTFLKFSLRIKHADIYGAI